ILEYQCLLMKISGIDGVIVDWYGMEPFWDYGVLNESTHALFDAARRFKLSFAVCYEDQSIKHMVENGRLPASEALAHGKQVMRYLQNNWFGDDAYLKLDGRPVLLVFGPQYFTESSQWTALFADLPTAPLFFTEDNRVGPAAVGAYPWPPMWKSNAQGILTQEALDEYLSLFYAKAKAWPYLIAGAFAGFRDIYRQAGVGAGYGVLDHRNGEVFRSTLQKAMDNQADIIQLVTWNDYGEGTMIEPTVEFGYRFLEIVQEARQSVDPEFRFQKTHLTMPLRILELRKSYATNWDVQAELNRVVDYLVEGKADEAVRLLNKLPAKVGSTAPPQSFSLRISPNPVNSTATLTFTMPVDENVCLELLDLKGRRLQALFNGFLAAGEHCLRWHSERLTPGIYLLKMSSSKTTAWTRCVIVK
ncbi:MAG: glycoside hydrolase family 99-like domain-containing protein, partial [candidate division KSB1 bacterium]|nr:glycoside hydrolase family 99-like domain-containing protein [candidate division KSB1 bacterium]